MKTREILLSTENQEISRDHNVEENIAREYRIVEDELDLSNVNLDITIMPLILRLPETKYDCFHHALTPLITVLKELKENRIKFLKYSSPVLLTAIEDTIEEFHVIFQKNIDKLSLFDIICFNEVEFLLEKQMKYVPYINISLEFFKEFSESYQKVEINEFMQQLLDFNENYGEALSSVFHEILQYSSSELLPEFFDILKNEEISVDEIITELRLYINMLHECWRDITNMKLIFLFELILKAQDQQEIDQEVLLLLRERYDNIEEDHAQNIDFLI